MPEGYRTKADDCAPAFSATFPYVQLILDAIKVKCPACGHREFRPPEKPLPFGSALTCARCEAQVYYRELEDQVRAEQKKV